MSYYQKEQNYMTQNKSYEQQGIQQPLQTDYMNQREFELRQNLKSATGQQRNEILFELAKIINEKNSIQDKSYKKFQTSSFRDTNITKFQSKPMEQQIDKLSTKITPLTISHQEYLNIIQQKPQKTNLPSKTYHDEYSGVSNSFQAQDMINKFKYHEVSEIKDNIVQNQENKSNLSIVRESRLSKVDELNSSMFQNLPRINIQEEEQGNDEKKIEEKIIDKKVLQIQMKKLREQQREYYKELLAFEKEKKLLEKQKQNLIEEKKIFVQEESNLRDLKDQVIGEEEDLRQKKIRRFAQKEKNRQQLIKQYVEKLPQEDQIRRDREFDKLFKQIEDIIRIKEVEKEQRMGDLQALASREKQRQNEIKDKKLMTLIQQEQEKQAMLEKQRKLLTEEQQRKIENNFQKEEKLMDLIIDERARLRAIERDRLVLSKDQINNVYDEIDNKRIKLEEEINENIQVSQQNKNRLNLFVEKEKEKQEFIRIEKIKKLAYQEQQRNTQIILQREILPSQQVAKIENQFLQKEFDIFNQIDEYQKQKRERLKTLKTFTQKERDKQYGIKERELKIFIENEKKKQQQILQERKRLPYKVQNEIEQQFQYQENELNQKLQQSQANHNIRKQKLIELAEKEIERQEQVRQMKIQNFAQLEREKQLRILKEREQLPLNQQEKIEQKFGKQWFQIQQRIKIDSEEKSKRMQKLKELVDKERNRQEKIRLQKMMELTENERFRQEQRLRDLQKESSQKYQKYIENKSKEYQQIDNQISEKYKRHVEWKNQLNLFVREEQQRQLRIQSEKKQSSLKPKDFKSIKQIQNEKMVSVINEQKLTNFYEQFEKENQEADLMIKYLEHQIINGKDSPFIISQNPTQNNLQQNQIRDFQPESQQKKQNLNDFLKEKRNENKFSFENSEKRTIENSYNDKYDQLVQNESEYNQKISNEEQQIHQNTTQNITNTNQQNQISTNNETIKVTRRKNMSKEERQNLILGLQQKLDGLMNILQKTDPETKMFKTYQGIADQLRRDISQQQDLLQFNY